MKVPTTTTATFAAAPVADSNKGGAHQVLVEGEVLSGQALTEFAAKHGLCPICVSTKTHRKVGATIWQKSWQPMTVTKEGPEQQPIVYKGYCLQPTCYTLEQAQEILGETTNTTTKTKQRRPVRRGGKRRHHNKEAPTVRGVMPHASHTSLWTQSTAHNSSSQTLASRDHLNISGHSIPAVTVLHSSSSHEQRARAQLEAAAQDGNTCKILQLLQEEEENRDGDATAAVGVDVVVTALQHVRRLVVQAQENHVLHEVLPSPMWMTVTQRLLRRALGAVRQETTTLAIVATWTTLASVAPRFAQTLVQHDGVQLLVRILDRGHSDRVATAVWSALETVTAHAAVTEAPPLQILAQAIASMIDRCEPVTLPLALRVMWNVRVKAVVSDDRAAVELVQTTLIDIIVTAAQNTDVFWRVLEQEESVQTASEAAVFVLLQVATAAGKRGGRFPMSSARVMALVRALALFKTQTLRIMAFGLWSSATFPQVKHAAGDLEWMETADLLAKYVVLTLESWPDNRTLQVAGVAALVNLFLQAMPILTAVAQQQIVHMTATSATVFAHDSRFRYMMLQIVAKTFYSKKAVLADALTHVLAIIEHDHGALQRQAIKVVADMSEVEGATSLLVQLGAIDVLEGAVASNRSLQLKVQLHGTLRNVVYSVFGTDKGKICDGAREKRLVVGSSSLGLLRVAHAKDSIVTECCDFLSALYRHLTGPMQHSYMVSLHLPSIQRVICINVCEHATSIIKTMMSPGACFKFRAACLALLGTIVRTACKDAENAELLRFASTIGSLLFSAMQENKNDERFVTDSITILVQMRDGLDSHLAAEILKDVVDGITRFAGSDDYAILATSAMSTMVSVSKQPQKLVREVVSIDALLQMLTAASEHIVERALLLLTVWLGEHDSQAQADAVHIVNAVTECTARWKTSMSIQRHGLRLLDGMLDAKPALLDDMAHSNTLLICASSLSKSREDEALVCAACSVLTKVLPFLDDELVLSRRRDLSDALVNATAANACNKATIQTVASSIGKLCQRADYFKLLLARTSPILVAAIAARTTDAAHLHAILPTFRLLSSIENAMEFRLLSATIVMLTDILLIHVDTPDIAVETLSILKNIATLKGVRHTLDRPLVADAILIAMQSQCDNARVMAAALTALNNVVVDVESRQTLAIAPSTLELIMDVMYRFEREASVQKNACLLLKSYMYSGNMHAVAHDNSQALSSLLLAAAERFPHECLNRAEFIMDRL